MDWNRLCRRILGGEAIKRDEALAILESDDSELLGILNSAYTVRQYYFGRNVGLHVLSNAKSGSCIEDCSFCSQSAISVGKIPRYPLMPVEQLLKGAREAHEMGANRYCIVTSGKNPSNKDLEVICEAVRMIKRKT